MTEIEARRKLVNWCNSQVGYHEGADNYNKYAADPRMRELLGWDAQNQPWCDIFTDYAFIACFGLAAASEMTYQPIGHGSAACRYSADFFRDHGAFTRDPEIGDVVFFYSSGAINHQGIVTDVNAGRITTVEGNSSDQVARRGYDAHQSNIAGYGRPKWSVVADGSDSQPEDPGEGGVIVIVDPDEPAPATSCTATLPVLREGMTSEAVRRLQILLIGLGYYCGGRRLSNGREQPDGEFGQQTTASIGLYQASVDMPVTGVMDGQTWAALIGGAK